MLRPAPHIRYHIAAILAAHWIQFVLQYKNDGSDQQDMGCWNSGILEKWV